MFTMASIARFTRSEMIEVLDSDYMLLAESKGISGPALIFRHALKDGEHTGIGLINVFSRLRIYFHRDDVFDIFSRDDSEMKFLIRIPNV